MDESCSAGLYVNTWQLSEIMLHIILIFLTVKAASQALRYASIWYATKGEKKISVVR